MSASREAFEKAIAYYRSVERDGSAPVVAHANALLYNAQIAVWRDEGLTSK